MPRAVRLRVPELFQERGMTPYAVAKASEGKISLSTAYRMTRLKGRLETFDAGILSALCDVLDVAPAALLERSAVARGATSRR